MNRTVTVLLAILSLCLCGQSGFSQAGPPAPSADVQRLIELAKDVSWKDGMPKLQEALKRARELRDRPGEALALLWISRTYSELDDPNRAVENNQLALGIFREVGDRGHEMTILNNLGSVYEDLNKFEDAIHNYAAALVLRKELKDQVGEGTNLNDIGRCYASLKKYGDALKYYEQALAVRRQLPDRRPEASTLTFIGDLYSDQKQHGLAIEWHQKALAIRRAARDQGGIGNSLMAIALEYSELGNQGKMLEYALQAIPIRHAIDDKLGEANALLFVGLAYVRLDQHATGAKYLEQAAPLLLRSLRLRDAALAEFQAARAYGEADKYAESLQRCDDALAILKLAKDTGLEAQVLGVQGSALDKLGRRGEAIEVLTKSLALTRQAKDSNSEIRVLSLLGTAYFRAGQTGKALDLVKEAMALAVSSHDREAEGTAHNQLGAFYDELKDYRNALEHYLLALKFHRDQHRRKSEAVDLSNLAGIYARIEDWKQSIDYLNQAIEIQIQVGDRRGQAQCLSNLGYVYQFMGKPADAMRYYLRALPMQREVQDRDGEAVTLSNMCVCLRDSAPALATFYGKLAVNCYQSLRKDLLKLDQNSKAAFRDKVGTAYRDLADLLIAAGRIPEAEQVLRLLKDDELYTFVRRADDSLGGAAAYTPAEAEWDKQYEAETSQLVALGTQAQELLRVNGRTAAQVKRLQELNAQIRLAEEKFQQFLDRILEKSKGLNIAANRLDRVADAQGIQSTLARLPAGTVAVYTLAAPDALRIVFVTPSAVRAHTVKLKASELSALVATFRRALQDPGSDARGPGKALYDALISPIEADLQQAGAKTIMWSLDGSLRYIPIAALWDGRQFVLERFGISIFNPSSAARLEREPARQWRALAAGVSLGRTVNEDGLERVFSPLSGVRSELDAVVATFPGSSELLDPGFTVDAFTSELLKRPTVVHLATHFAFNTGDETRSFLLTGSGPVLSIGQARSMTGLSLQSVSLLTLSACETGLGGSYGDGSEVESIAVIFQKKGAEAVLSSLWQVADEPTRLLMTQMYRNRRQHPEWTKLECLRQAQIALIRGQLKGSSAAGRAGNGAEGGAPVIPTNPNAPLAHPYFWAPFILSGNWK